MCFKSNFNGYSPSTKLELWNWKNIIFLKQNWIKPRYILFILLQSWKVDLQSCLKNSLRFIWNSFYIWTLCAGLWLLRSLKCIVACGRSWNGTLFFSFLEWEREWSDAKWCKTNAMGTSEATDSLLLMELTPVIPCVITLTLPTCISLVLSYPIIFQFRKVMFHCTARTSQCTKSPYLLDKG